MREVLSQQEDTLLNTPHPQGVPELREAIAAPPLPLPGHPGRPSPDVVGAGSEVLTSLLVQLLGREGRYGVENPGYTKTHRILGSCGVQVEPIPLDNQGLMVDELDRHKVQVVHVTPLPPLSPGHHHAGDPAAGPAALGVQAAGALYPGGRLRQ